ncbi:vWA domain-containing protein [methane-oxidizing endosymbiont of Gigantopelta aegis]|uniref:vWA domain-containing protein n=1 Tax=methane-oxidizing endosymbiont of Gigantopelta aegis TaxID=2794938 RepID=UPI0018DD35F5|nr:vWA domain-containing protein [methane-oxidizing endosymbiont of Gigantopelta aegis]
MFRQHLLKNLKDYRFYGLSLALLAMLALFIKPQIIKRQAVYDFTLIVDITRSMNARDYQVNDEAASRLQFVKRVLHDVVLQLPCQSKVGIGLFTERKSTLLFEPIEVCSAYAEIDSVIENIDWRMAWAADSRISKGLLSTLTQLQDRANQVVFFTDGHEAPPVNPRYKTDFSDVKGKLKGVLVGVGGLQNVPIPKYDNRGQQQGFYQPEDVPHRSTFGLPPTSLQPWGAYHARNAPFGGAKVVGNQHLTRLYEPYLQQLAKDIGWAYHRLENSEQLKQALFVPEFARQQKVASDNRIYFAVIALVLLGWVYFPRRRAKP